MNRAARPESAKLREDVWFNYRGFYDSIGSFGFSRLAEVGVFKGASLRHLASRTLAVNPDARFLAVDPFFDTYEAEYLAKMQQSGFRDRVTDIKGFSPDAALTVPDGSLDFVFLDGDHSYEAMSLDLPVWHRKLRPGGIQAGHDYSSASWPGVVKAVNEFLIANRLGLFQAAGTVWFTVKT